MDYVIAIPSYKRATTLKEKTLSLIDKYQIPHHKVTIFVANEEEYEIYKRILVNFVGNIVIGNPGMGAIRRFIQQYYCDGIYVVNMDDDLSAIQKKIDDKTLADVENFENEVIIPGFTACIENNANLWGIYAASNPMFMSHKIAVGLYYCIGSLWGVINRTDEDLAVTLDDKEDNERTLQHYIKDGAVVRLNNITVKSKYFTENGGMQVERTKERIYESAKFLAEKYPELCKMYIRETTGHAELRMRDTRKIKPSLVSEKDSLEQFF